ncbi:unnamed protein product [Ambrosiozyma monospora]|uniref:Unnamed protein product n=1 Tax=Ambrosiozyma monospora TaxID=43982 RepID=A0A9W6YS52_AMBMO|nr:unnamed protein product [Ambrosiozyma monospora]
MVEVSLTVGKLDASLALLLTKDHHLIEFPTILLPDGISTGSIVKINCDRDFKQEEYEDAQFEKLQEEIFETFGKHEPAPPNLKILNVTQTSCVLEWDPLELGTAKLKSLMLYKNGEKLGPIKNPASKKNIKLSGLPVETEYSFQLKLDTTAGVYHSNNITFKTHKMTDLSGITICVGDIDYTNEPFVEEDITDAVTTIGAKPLSDKVRIDTTQFICTKKTGIEYEKAKNMNIPIIRPEWIKACELERRIVGVNKFYLDSEPQIWKQKDFWKATQHVRSHSTASAIAASAATKSKPSNTTEPVIKVESQPAPVEAEPTPSKTPEPSTPKAPTETSTIEEAVPVAEADVNADDTLQKTPDFNTTFAPTTDSLKVHIPEINVLAASPVVEPKTDSPESDTEKDVDAVTPAEKEEGTKEVKEEKLVNDEKHEPEAVVEDIVKSANTKSSPVESAIEDKEPVKPVEPVTEDKEIVELVTEEKEPAESVKQFDDVNLAKESETKQLTGFDDVDFAKDAEPVIVTEEKGPAEPVEQFDDVNLAKESETKQLTGFDDVDFAKDPEVKQEAFDAVDLAGGSETKTAAAFDDVDLSNGTEAKETPSFDEVNLNSEKPSVDNSDDIDLGSEKLVKKEAELVNADPVTDDVANGVPEVESVKDDESKENLEDEEESEEVDDSAKDDAAAPASTKNSKPKNKNKKKKKGKGRK